MFSPHKWEHLTASQWRDIHTGLKEALAQEIKDAEPLAERLNGPAWFVDVSNRMCGYCHTLALRVRIKGHPDSPFYACIPCGRLAPYAALTYGDKPEDAEGQ